VARYRIYGLTLASAEPLPELQPAEGSIDCRFRLLAASPAEPAPVDWFHRWLLPDDTVGLMFAKHEGGYLLRFPGTADFLVSRDGREISSYSPPESAPETVRHLLLDTVLPLTLSLRGALALHAGAIMTPHGAIGFVGPSGRGKSTLTASFCRAGFRLVTDDCLVVRERSGRICAEPSYPGLRLWPESMHSLYETPPPTMRVTPYASKLRLAAGQGGITFENGLVPLRRLFLLAPEVDLGESQEVSISPISPRDAVIELVRYAFKLDVTDRSLLQHEFDRLTRLVKHVPLRRLSFPHDLSRLPQVQAKILADIARS